jgi:DNA-binding transcriptional ArsR family regulator
VDEIASHERRIEPGRAPATGRNDTRAEAERPQDSPRGLTARARRRRLPFVNAYRTAVDPLDALGDATRRAIVEGLRDGERAVGDLATGLPVSRPAVSQHLGVLKAAGLVLERPEGTRRYYRLDPTGLTRLQNHLDAMWGGEPVAAEAARAVKLAASQVEELPAAPAGPAPAPSGKGHKKHKKKGGRK